MSADKELELKYKDGLMDDGTLDGAGVVKTRPLTKIWRGPKKSFLKSRKTDLTDGSGNRLRFLTQEGADETNKECPRRKTLPGTKGPKSVRPILNGTSPRRGKSRSCKTDPNQKLFSTCKADANQQKRSKVNNKELEKSATSENQKNFVPAKKQARSRKFMTPERLKAVRAATAIRQRRFRARKREQQAKEKTKPVGPSKAALRARAYRQRLVPEERDRLRLYNTIWKRKSRAEKKAAGLEKALKDAERLGSQSSVNTAKLWEELARTKAIANNASDSVPPVKRKFTTATERSLDRVRQLTPEQLESVRASDAERQRKYRAKMKMLDSFLGVTRTGPSKAALHAREYRKSWTPERRAHARLLCRLGQRRYREKKRALAAAAKDALSGLALPSQDKSSQDALETVASSTGHPKLAPAEIKNPYKNKVLVVINLDSVDIS